MEKIGRQAAGEASEKDDGSLVRGVCDASLWSSSVLMAGRPVICNICWYISKIRILGTWK